ncbi:phosphate ABC transporter substrate-binding protein PstS family protein [Lactococcus termiticola]|uniref:Phosphate-binding protein n=1 Tax=Lactococcus termiticola TaxID=2169526 RepID=A0A2R5HGE0_9LACT|nr:phosphate ABC transporter substrate-binding protein PstS family protein [Lactococcus termiticola]GBG97052.1 phosphate ABC transporter substrate-binding protein [Lactococcus termiticola]
MKKKIFMAILAASSMTLLAACSTGAKQVTAGGSTALQPLVERSSLDYMKVHSNSIITVQGGGSGVGLAQVAAGSFQIGNSDIFAEEKSGIDVKKITDHKVAAIGFAPIVNSKLDIKNLSKQQLVDVFTGKVKNWKEVGGPDLAITVIGRTAGSGTRVNFDKYALNGATEVNGPSQDASGSVVQLLSQTPGAISYVSFSYKAKPGVKALSVDGVAPSDANVQTNKWKIWSYEHMYTNKKQDNKIEENFIDYVKADTASLKKLGYIPMAEMKVDRSADGKISRIK